MKYWIHSYFVSLQSVAWAGEMPSCRLGKRGRLYGRRGEKGKWRRGEGGGPVLANIEIPSIHFINTEVQPTKI